ncbi:MAG: 2-oxoacid:acceptor oxidoreductase family protein [Planctomycetales bacterium]|nr:2-oxoacid:acceptor oxidoreductase family protein [Planctomycetales bacterium]
MSTVVDPNVKDARDEEFTNIPEEKKNESKYQYPGIPVTCDGAAAVVHVETAVCHGSGAYPITSSTTMGSGFNNAVHNGDTNLWGDPLVFMEPESEHSSASFCEGFALAGGRVTNFTSGQGLVLMKEVLYTISGKRLPVVFNIGARALTSHSLNVHAGHDDVMSVADVGWGMLFGRNAQEAADLCLIARRAAEASQTPFFNVQDGFLTTHTVETARLPELEFMKEYVGNPNEKLVNLMDPENPMMSGVVQNQDSYMKGKIAQRWYYDRVAPALEEAFDIFAKKTGRHYDFVMPHRCEDAEYIIIGLGGYMETTEVTVDYLREKGIKAGCLTVYCFRPFPMHQIVSALKDAKAITIFERMDDPLSTTGNHLTREIKAAFCDAMTGQMGHERIDRVPRIYHGAAGLGSRHVRPADIIAAVDNMKNDGQDYFCVGIDHPLALKRTEDPDLRPSGGFSMRGHSVGGFGSVTTNKVIATIAGEVFGKDVQAYPKYGSEKKGLPTTYYLTIGDAHIKTHSELEFVDLIILNDVNAILANPLHGVVDGGAIFMQSPYDNPQDVWQRIPERHKKTIRKKNIRLYFCDTVKIAREVASVADLQMRMQGVVTLGAFLKLTPYAKNSGISDDQVMAGVEEAIRKYFGKRGERVVQDNMTCIRRGYKESQEVPRDMIGA